MVVVDCRSLRKAAYLRTIWNCRAFLEVAHCRQASDTTVREMTTLRAFAGQLSTAEEDLTRQVGDDVLAVTAYSPCASAIAPSTPERGPSAGATT